MPIISGGGGGGGVTPDLADVLTEGADAAGRGMDNLGDSTMQGGSWLFDGDNEEYPRGTGNEAGQTGGSAGSLYFAASANTTGAEAALQGGFGQSGTQRGGTATLKGGDSANGNSGASVACEGGFSSVDGEVKIKTAGSLGTVGQVLVSYDTSGAVVYDDLGAIKCDTHAAPADGVLAAGDLYLWFDQTNGAAKLMVKAKTADGTVVSAAIALA